MTNELTRKNLTLEKETRKEQKVEEELKVKKKDHGAKIREVTKLEQQIKESVSVLYLFFKLDYYYQISIYKDIGHLWSIG